MKELYDEWCEKIAKSKSIQDLITHFREHACDHYERHSRDGGAGLDIWLIGVLNFMHIFEKKFSHITVDDLLFKLCTYHRNHEGGVAPPFDIDEFLKEYDGEIKKFHKISQ